MRLVEQHGGDAVQPRIALQPADQQPFGHHLHPRRGGPCAIQPRGKADGVAEFLPQQRGHAARGGTGRHAAGFQDQDFLVARPVLPHQHQRDDRRLAGAGRRDQDSIRSGGQRLVQRGQGLVDGKLGEHGGGR